MADRDYVITANLSLLRGEITLPHPDEFNGEHWKIWASAVDETAEANINRLYAFAGLRFIAAAGHCDLYLVDADGVDTPLPLETVQEWQGKPKQEKTRIVNFIGREMNRYMVQILDPKG